MDQLINGGSIGPNSEQAISCESREDNGKCHQPRHGEGQTRADLESPSEGRDHRESPVEYPDDTWGARVARVNRMEANRLSPAEREDLLAWAIQTINGEDKA